MQSASAADFLLEMRLTGRREAGLPRHLVPASLEDAYRTQAELVDKLIALHGGQRIGYKAACTSELAQRLLKVDAPLVGALLSCSTHRSPARLRASDYSVRCIEAEFGFEIGADVPESKSAYSADSIAAYIFAAVPAIEVVDHRFRDWGKVGAETLVADNALHGAWVAGDPCPDWQGIDFPSHPVALYVNGAIARTGSGAAVLGNPLNVVAWLANELPRLGLRLRQGDRVSTGITTDVYFANAGDRLKADFGAMGSVALAFEGE